MIITSVVLLAGAFVLLVLGAVQGNPTMLGVSLGAAAAGALALFAGNASAKRVALARGVPVEAVLAGRIRRTSATEAAPTEPPGPPPIEGYDDMSPSEVTRLVASGAMAEEHLSDMLVYEASHRRRREVLTAIMEVVGPDAGPADARPPGARPSPRGGRAPSGTRPAKEARRGAREATLAEDEVDDRAFARAHAAHPEPPLRPPQRSSPG